MKKHHIALFAAVALLVGTLVVAQSDAPAQAKPAADSRIDKLLEQNDQILKNQQEIMKVLEQLKTDMNQLRRRTS
jgi:hypothetical protein